MKMDLNGKLSLKDIKGHLFPKDINSENALFLFAKDKISSFEIIDYRMLSPYDFEIQLSYHIQIKSEVLGQLIKKVHDLNACLIEIHSHLEKEKASFSLSDWNGFNDFVPHILWRLPSRPYGALVFTYDSFDGIYWKNDVKRPKVIQGIIDGNKTVVSTGLSLKLKENYGK